MLAPEFNEFAGIGIGQRVGAFLKIEDIAGPCRQVEGRSAAADQRGSRYVGYDPAGVEPPDRARDIAVDSAFGRQDDVQHLALGRIFGAVKVAGSDFDADHPAGGNVAQHVGQRFRLGAWPRAVDHDIASCAREAARRDIAEVERKARNQSGNVERGLRRRWSEECRIIDSCLGPLAEPAGGASPCWARAGEAERGRKCEQAQLRQTAYASITPPGSDWPRANRARSLDEAAFDQSTNGSMSRRNGEAFIRE